MSIIGKDTNIHYGNWVSQKLLSKVILFLLIFACGGLLLFIFPKNPRSFVLILRVVSIFLSAFFLTFLIYLIIAKQKFSYTGGKLQEKVIKELLSTINWNGNGKALDIGCGSGFLTISLAKKFVSAKIVGLDFWGNNWDYSKKQCDINAKSLGVSKNIDFIKGSASKLPFNDGTFDLVVSNMTFHKVYDSKEKTTPIFEALRVLKKGSVFAFQDLFLLKSYFGTIDELMNKIKSAGVEKISFINTSQLEFVPKYLKLPFMLGATAILYVIK